MGSDSNRFIIFMVFSSLLSSIVSDTYDPMALNALFMHHANRTLATNHTGTIHQVSLPSNFSGMEVSVTRLRSGSLWGRGTGSIYVTVPPRVRTLPYVKRLVIVYDNLGDWSSKYYHVPGYSFVSPIIGFKLYDYSDVTTLRDVNFTLSISDEPISIRFPYVRARGENVTRLKCVEFGDDGSVKFKNMSERNVCVTDKAGHFCVVKLTVPEKKGRRWKPWVIGIVIGAVGFVVLVPMGVIVLKLWRKMKIKNMEKESDSSVALDTIWVKGSYKMPSASMIRTQPTIEHDYVP